MFPLHSPCFEFLNLNFITPQELVQNPSTRYSQRMQQLLFNMANTIFNNAGHVFGMYGKEVETVNCFTVWGVLGFTLKTNHICKSEFPVHMFWCWSMSSGRFQCQMGQMGEIPFKYYLRLKTIHIDR